MCVCVRSRGFGFAHVSLVHDVGPFWYAALCDSVSTFHKQCVKRIDMYNMFHLYGYVFEVPRHIICTGYYFCF